MYDSEQAPEHTDLAECCLAPSEHIRGGEETQSALLPVVNMHNASCVGYALRFFSADRAACVPAACLLGPVSPSSLCKSLEATLIVCAAAMQAFTALGCERQGRLFLHVDVSIALFHEEFVPRFHFLMTEHGLESRDIVLGFSAYVPFSVQRDCHDQLERLQTLAGKFFIDNFGVGSSSLALLLLVRPQYTFFGSALVTASLTSGRHRTVLRHVVRLGHLLGVHAVATDIQTEQQYTVCRDIGFDFLQAYISSPFAHSRAAESNSFDAVMTCVQHLNAREQRSNPSDRFLVQGQMTYIQPVCVDCILSDVLDRFRREMEYTFFPVVSADDEPLGLLREQDLKEYVYAPFGKELLSNRGYGKKVSDFLWPCPSADIRMQAEELLEIFSQNEQSEGILITDRGRYVGFLSARALLFLLNEKNMAQARDQNPLTRLPGNASVNRFLSQLSCCSESSWAVVYWDFDHFKPFNDQYGFRQGDRAIMLFVDLLNRHFSQATAFMGHIGGDDFVVVFRDMGHSSVLERVRYLADKFRNSIESFYDPQSRERGYIVARDRAGVERDIPLLSVSAAVLFISPESLSFLKQDVVDSVAQHIAPLKHQAKQAPDKIACAELRAEFKKSDLHATKQSP